MATYYFSDPHFNDPNILVYSRQQFKNIEEMNELIIKNWNETISDNDTVYLLGDIGDYEYLKRLKGKIIIVLGNHDKEEKLKAVLPDIKYYDKPIIDRFLILSHEPISFLPKELPYLNIHGHLHQFDYRIGTSLNWYDGNRYFNVSCEKIGYRPISDKQIMEIVGYIDV